MTIAVLCTPVQWEELNASAPGCVWLNHTGSDAAWPEADAYMVLHNYSAGNLPQTSKPIFIHAVSQTLKQLHQAPNVVRINAWVNFLQRSTWEISGEITSGITSVMLAMNKKWVAVADEPGLIAARIIAMIINEGYFALGEGVSNKAAIDTAMKFGTNYPFGPFEWCSKIGILEIYHLLNTLAATDPRCKPAPFLIQEAEQ